MKILGVIPARYGSTRFPGKPLVDILGKPMIWWVYQQAKRAKKLTNLIVATDVERISRVCDKFDIPLMMTREQPNCFYRLHEVSLSIKADKYLLINGDEPLIKREVIQEMINEVILK
ncbi:NTP transferase domain-containing protein, partial [Campylobacter jejuni]|uniref:cytidylyltransferase domain-containing protein n=1 Tax=Campylobacter jejuni TaxID=197 RepID=UPI002B22B413